MVDKCLYVYRRRRVQNLIDGVQWINHIPVFVVVPAL